MAVVKTLQNLYDECRGATDTEFDVNIVDTTHLRPWINSEIRRLWSVISRVMRDEYTVNVLFSITAGNTHLITQTDFLEVRGVDLDLGGSNFQKLRPWRFPMRSHVGRVGYRVLFKTIHILPSDAAVGDYRLWYVRQPADLVLTTDSIDLPLAGDDYVVQGVASRIRARREEEVQYHIALQADAESRVRRWAQTHNMGDQDAGSDIGDDEVPEVWGW